MKHFLRRLPQGEAVLPLLLVSLLVLMFVAWPLADIGVFTRPFIGMIMTVVALSALLAVRDGRGLAWPVLFLGILFILLQFLIVLNPSGPLILMGEAVAMLFLTLICIVLLLGVFGPGRVSMHRIIGAVVIYLLIALLFSLMYDVIERFWPGAFTVGAEQAGPTPSGARFFYLSVITLTSVGFGDMAPLHPIARSAVMVEAILGQIYTTVLLAWLVSLEVAHGRAQRIRSSGRNGNGPE